MGNDPYRDTASGAARPFSGPSEPGNPGSNDTFIGADDSERHGGSHETTRSFATAARERGMSDATHHVTSTEALSHQTSEALAAGEKDMREQWPVHYLSEDNLAAPEPRPGMTQRWVRISIHNENDNINWSRAMRMGWAARHPSSLTENERRSLPVKQSGDASYIQVEDLVLCEMPIEQYKLITKAASQKNDRQMEAIFNDVHRVSEEGQKQGFAPITVDQFDVRTGLGKGRRPPVMDD